MIRAIPLVDLQFDWSYVLLGGLVVVLVLALRIYLGERDWARREQARGRRDTSLENVMGPCIIARSRTRALDNSTYINAPPSPHARGPQGPSRPT